MLDNSDSNIFSKCKVSARSYHVEDSRILRIRLESLIRQHNRLVDTLENALLNFNSQVASLKNQVEILQNVVLDKPIDSN